MYVDWFTLQYYGGGLSINIIEEFGHNFDQYTWDLIDVANNEIESA
jgi:hypothetical protein